MDYLDETSMHSRGQQIVKWTFACLTVTCLIGCGKNKQDEFPASPPNANQAPQATAATPTTPNQPAAVDNRKTYAQVESALKTKDYVGAVDAALALGRQQQQMTDAQAQAARNQMIRLQASVAAGVESGDPKAKAAADRLRAAAAHH